jgi:hypothetical protein
MEEPAHPRRRIPVRIKSVSVVFFLLTSLSACAKGRVWYSPKCLDANYSIELLVAGRSLPVAHVGEKSYVLGRMNESYVVRVHNRTNRRVEALISVDGRDAIDGQPSDLSKRGYVIGPYSYVDVDGFRLNMDEVAAFRFTSRGDSYAVRMGSGREQLGMIGVAVFSEHRYIPRPKPPVVMKENREHELYPRPDASDFHAKRHRSWGHSPQAKNLGTRFGERRSSAAEETRFVRQKGNHPASRLSLRYDDRHGLCAIGLHHYCHSHIHPHPRPYPDYPIIPRRQESFSEPPPGWDHFSSWY